MVVLALGLGASGARAQTPAASVSPATAGVAPRPSWMTRSDVHAQVLLDVIARFGPEFAGQIGINGLDEQVLDLQPRRYEREQEATQKAIAELELRRAREKDLLVKQDLDILIQSGKENVEGDELSHKYELAYFDVPLTMFRGLRALLDDQVAPA